MAVCALHYWKGLKNKKKQSSTIYGFEQKNLKRISKYSIPKNFLIIALPCFSASALCAGSNTNQSITSIFKRSSYSFN